MVLKRSDPATAYANGWLSMAFIPTHPLSDVLAADPRGPLEAVTGDAPQPGETPRTEGNPWSFDPDAAWWRGDGDREQAEALAEAAARPRNPRRRSGGGTATEKNAPGRNATGSEPAFAPEAPDAHGAGVHDATGALNPGQQVEAEQENVIEQAESAAAAETVEHTKEHPVAERDHDKRTPETYNPAEPDDVMVLPDRPTVPLERGPLGRGPVPGARRSAADLDIKRSRVENSPFWMGEAADVIDANAWPSPETRNKPANAPTPIDDHRGRPPRRRPRSPHDAAPGLFGLIALALIAAFFSWVSAEPFWLAIGHGEAGFARVSACTGSGVTQRCAGSFTAADGSFTTGPVSLMGIDRAGRNPGAVAPARMVDARSKQAYAGGTGILLQLRWTLGFALVLLCGLGIAGLTGTRQLETVQARRTALLTSMAGPVLLLIGFLFATY
jgi:hypothetical protein